MPLRLLFSATFFFSVDTNVFFFLGSSKDDTDIWRRRHRRLEKGFLANSTFKRGAGWQTATFMTWMTPNYFLSFSCVWTTHWINGFNSPAHGSCGAHTPEAITMLLKFVFGETKIKSIKQSSCAPAWASIRCLSLRRSCRLLGFLFAESPGRAVNPR